MLPGGLHHPAPTGTLITPDSTYEWRRKGEHVKVRTGQVSQDQRADALAMFNKLVAESFTVLSVAGPHLRVAAKFVGQHALGLWAGDALHLATALEHGATLYTLD